MVTKPGKLTLAYTAKMMEYIEAADEYMNLKIDAQSTTGDDPEAKRRVHAWAAKSKAVPYGGWQAKDSRNTIGGFYITFYSPSNSFDTQQAWPRITLQKEEINALIRSAPPELKPFISSESDLLNLVISQAGDSYVFGVEVRSSESDPLSDILTC